MRKPLTREQPQALYELRMEPNTEGGQDGITWFGVPGLFAQRRGNNQPSCSGGTSKARRPPRVRAGHRRTQQCFLRR
jgi:hypothetical protein